MKEETLVDYCQRECPEALHWGIYQQMTKIVKVKSITYQAWVPQQHRHQHLNGDLALDLTPTQKC
jgi:hypothetical protein